MERKDAEPEEDVVFNNFKRLWELLDRTKPLIEDTSRDNIDYLAEYMRSLKTGPKPPFESLISTAYMVDRYGILKDDIFRVKDSQLIYIDRYYLFEDGKMVEDRNEARRILTEILEIPFNELEYKESRFGFEHRVVVDEMPLNPLAGKVFLQERVYT